MQADSDADLSERQKAESDKFRSQNLCENRDRFAVWPILWSRSILRKTTLCQIKKTVPEIWNSLDGFCWWNKNGRGWITLTGIAPRNRDGDVRPPIPPECESSVEARPIRALTHGCQQLWEGQRPLSEADAWRRGNEKKRP